MASRLVAGVALLGAAAIGLLAATVLWFLLGEDDLGDDALFVIWFELPLGLEVTGLEADEMRWVKALCAGVIVAALFSAATALRSIVWGASARAPVLALVAAVACCAAVALLGDVH